MTSREHLKKELMVYGIQNDYFGYGSSCKKRSDGKYVTIVDGERYEFTGKELADQWDTLEPNDKKDILESFSERELNVSIDFVNNL